MGDEDVVGLNVSMDDSFAVQVQQGLPDLKQHFLYFVCCGALAGQTRIYLRTGRT